MASMSDAAQKLRRLPMALEFGLKIDRDAVEREIENENVISGGSSFDAATARLALIMSNSRGDEIAREIAKHRDQLVRHLDPLFIDALLIEGASEIRAPE